MKQLFKYYTSVLAHPTKIKLGLEVISALDKELGSPSKQFSSIHVAGTNGKGSVTTKIAYALHYEGVKVGRYTSPHLRSFQERIWTKGELISEERMSNYVKRVEHQANRLGVRLTFFELLTLVAFLQFAEAKVEMAVVEVGMGGRLDATNIIQPQLSIITSIDFDHKEFLGESLEEIAYEKGGIIKEGIPLIVGAKIGPLALLQKIAEEKKSALYVAEEGEDFEEQNQKTASLALDHIVPNLSFSSKSRGLLMKPPCRFHLIQEKPSIILDVAHNLAGVNALLEKVERHFPGKSICVVASFSSEEKGMMMAAAFKQKAARVYLTKANHERGVAAPKVEGCFEVESIAKTLFLAEEYASCSDTVLLIAGSFFMMEEVFSFFEGRAGKGFLPDWSNLTK